MDMNQQPISSGRAWFAVAVLMVAYALAMLDRTILFMMVEPLKRDLGLTDTGIGMLHGLAFVVFYTLAGFPLGRMADSMSRRGIISVGIVAWSGLTMLSGLAQNFWHLFLARTGVGIGEAALNPAAFSMIADMFSKERLARAMSLFLTGSVLGSGAAFIFGGFVLDILSSYPTVTLPIVGDVRGWQVAFFAAGAPGFLVALVMLAIPEPRRTGGTKETSVPLRGLWQFIVQVRRPLFCHFLGFGLLTLVIYATMSWAPTFLVRIHGLQTSAIGLIMGTIVGVFGAAGFFCGAALADRFVRNGRLDAHLRVGMIGGLGCAPFAVAATTAESAVIAVPCLCMAFFFLSLPPAAGMAGLQLLTPHRLRAQIASLYMLITNLVGLGLGPLIVGMLNDGLFGGGSLPVNYSLLIVYATFIPCVAMAYGLGMKSFGEQVARQDAAARVP